MTDKSPIHASVDFAKAGKQLGHLGIPYSHNLGGWANLMLPIAVIARGSGPTALVMAGNHGDEYPGQVAILRLMRELAAGASDAAGSSWFPRSTCRRRRRRRGSRRWTARTSIAPFPAGPTAR